MVSSWNFWGIWKTLRYCVTRYPLRVGRALIGRIESVLFQSNIACIIFDSQFEVLPISRSMPMMQEFPWISTLLVICLGVVKRACVATPNMFIKSTLQVHYDSIHPLTWGQAGQDAGWCKTLSDRIQKDLIINLSRTCLNEGLCMLRSLGGHKWHAYSTACLECGACWLHAPTCTYFSFFLAIFCHARLQTIYLKCIVLEPWATN